MYKIITKNGIIFNDVELELIDEPIGACIFNECININEGDKIVCVNTKNEYEIITVKYYISFRTIMSHYYVTLKTLKASM